MKEVCMITDLPGIGDYEEPEVDDTEYIGGIPEEWYMWNEDRSEGWDETDEW